MKNTKIEWCDHTINFWWGCSEVSEACQNCYAREIAKRFKKDCWGKSPRWDRIEEASKEIYKLYFDGNNKGAIGTVFVNSMSDFFDERIHPSVYDALISLFLMCSSNWQFLILTKRAKNLNRFGSIDAWPNNVFFGITAENQKRLDERMKELEGFPHKVFLSCEPLLEEIDVTPYLDRIDWVICGGETGRKARPFNSMWAQKLFEDTHKFDSSAQQWTTIVPFFFKQFGDNKANVKRGEDWWVSTIREYPEWHYRNPRLAAFFKKCKQV